MAYVVPNSTLQLFKGINLDNRYLHTIYFASESAQDTWFTSKVTSALTFSNLMYRRYQANSVKIEVNANQLLGVTYMRFKNTRTNSKWFYAFVLGTDYINENTSVVYYEIDVMQTWFMQGGSVRPCRVLREHVNDDTRGLNLVAEPIGSEVYDCDLIGKMDDDLFNGEYSLIVNSTGTVSSSDIVKQGLVVGTKYKALPMQNGGSVTDYKQDIYDYMDTLLGNWDAGEQSQDIIDMYTVPTAIAEQGENFHEFAFQEPIPTQYDNYTPKNKKLMTYPFSSLVVTTHNGDAGNYKWEYMDGDDIDFRALGTAVGGGQIMAFPRVYNGHENNMDCAVTINEFPKSAYAYDAYSAWVANGGKTRLENDEKVMKLKGAQTILSASKSIATNTLAGITSGIAIAGGIMTANPALVLSGALSLGASVAGNFNTAVDAGTEIFEAKNKISYQWKDASYRPDISIGNVVPSIVVGGHYLNFYFYHMHVRDDEAKRIDDFFSCYGYAINKVKAPNLTGRQYWNFVQTENAVIAGDMPASSKDAIGRIFDGGITFWHDGDQVGNYRQSVSNGSINNPIV